MSVPLGFLVGLLNIKVEPPPEMGSRSLYIRYMHLQVDHIVQSLISYEYLVVVQEPVMPEDKLELVRSQLLGAIARRGDDAGSIVGREFPKLLYGNESVYARVPEAETVKNVQRSDLLAFHKQVFQYVSALN
jgi:zinc protease